MNYQFEHLFRSLSADRQSKPFTSSHCVKDSRFSLKECTWDIINLRFSDSLPLSRSSSLHAMIQACPIGEPASHQVPGNLRPFGQGLYILSENLTNPCSIFEPLATFSIATSRDHSLRRSRAPFSSAKATSGTPPKPAKKADNYFEVSFHEVNQGIPALEFLADARYKPG